MNSTLRILMFSFILFSTLSIVLSTGVSTLPVTTSRQLVGEWASCSTSTGLCIDVNKFSCSTSIARGQCPGGNNILCCRAPGGVEFGQCKSTYNGLCKRTTDCSTTTISGLCPGPSSVRCCPPSTPITSSPPLISGTSVPVTPGIYLQLNPPTNKIQFRSRRAASVRPVIVVHTAETGGGAGPPDNRAENTANFIRTRTDYGSYHILGDTDSIIQLVSFEKAAFHDGTGSNEWSIGISLAMKAEDWPVLDTSIKNQLVSVAAQMATMGANWFESQGVGKPAAKQLTREESNRADASGFVAHGTRDPTRRTDPGAAFPWTDFLSEYNKRI